MPYFDFYLVPVPIENKTAYEELAYISAQVLREYGAVRVVQCWLDPIGSGASTYHASEVRLDAGQYPTFLQVAGAREGETAVLSFVEWPDKAIRDAGMTKVTDDPRMQFQNWHPASTVAASLPAVSPPC
ncbi:MAG: hypothetical protein KatS3mg056_0599 [Chloroflexus sp.]|jgi:uncharacterized protein YbaA (DUF1428 family)|uniref:DUF1428 domain-containing protein n=1 Tax=Chloroflexus aurantiacus (strain ATCC 29366 / DSM 635 / J-10-fl) TaxID=324602 RepID=A9WHX6_CHLAA|nr:DUF1428 domain-containing protein [Chloroflexus aurantiacus]ABY35667.1 protein of unknown function DUF1428 [Chloroflexus aurantiacus J-10-fl]GIV91890.1 MAG: hypothetical protein KatS3mg056_0599 [Chloroflexus sp.]